MKRSASMLSLLFAVILTGIAGCSKDPLDLAAFQGKWKGQAKETGGMSDCTMVVAGKHLEFRAADTNVWYKGTLALREGVIPKQMVLKVTEAAARAKSYVGRKANGLYKLDGEILTIALNEPGVWGFPTNLGMSDNAVLISLKRE
jgi:uncharacterized protein (TIGR03067 family)